MPSVVPSTFRRPTAALYIIRRHAHKSTKTHHYDLYIDTYSRAANAPPRADHSGQQAVGRTAFRQARSSAQSPA